MVGPVRCGSGPGAHGAMPDTRKRPKELVGAQPFSGSSGYEQVRSPWSPPGPSLAGLAALEPGSRDRPVDHSSDRSGGSHLPLRARRNVRAGAMTSTTGLSTNLLVSRPTLSPSSWTLWTSCGYSSRRLPPMAHLLARLVAINDRWAQPFGDFNHRWLTALFRPLGPVKDLLHGRWLGHPLHGAATDLPDRAAAGHGHPRPRRPAGGRGHRAGRDDRHDARSRRSPAWPTTPTPTGRHGPARPRTRP